MIYLARPVFLFKPNWALSPPARSIKFELRPEDIGFGVEYFTPIPAWTVNTWEADLTLPDAATIASFDAFTAALVGPLNGFWLPIPVAAGQILAGADTAHFTIAAEQLSTFWNDRPDQHLFFTFGDGSQAAAKISGVVNNGDGTETVTLTTALPQIPDANTKTQKLHYVRLATDKEEGEFIAETIQNRKLAVVELPLEYAAAQQGLQPLYLFHFWANAPIGIDWYFTSFAAPVVSQGKLYNNFPISFANLADTCDGTCTPMKITAKPDANNPLGLFLPQPFSGILFAEIMVADYSNPDVQTKLFSGRVIKVEDQGSKLVADCENRFGLLKRKLPRLVKGQTCNNILYDQATCKVGRAFFETTVNIVTVNAVWPPTVVCTFAIAPGADKFKAANFLANGLFEAGVKQSYEARSIIASSWNAGAGQITLTLNMPLKLTQAGSQAQIVAGCDHTPTTCINKFNNYVNFSGFIAIPVRNPTLKAVNANPTSQGGK